LKPFKSSCDALPASPSHQLVLEATGGKLGVEVESPVASVDDSGLGGALGLLENAAGVHTDLLYVSAKRQNEAD